MTILQKLKSILGLGGDDDDRQSRDVSVTVERKRKEPGETRSTETKSAELETGVIEERASTTDANEGVDSDQEYVEDETSVDVDEDAVDEDAIDDDAVDEVGVDEDAIDNDMIDEVGVDEDATNGDAIDEPGDEEADAEIDDRDPTDDHEQSADENVEDDETEREPVNVIKGIGPAYADRLAAEGVETVADLTEADAESLSEGTDISPKRIQGWIDRAKVR